MWAGSLLVILALHAVVASADCSIDRNVNILLTTLQGCNIYYFNTSASNVIVLQVDAFQLRPGAGDLLTIYNGTNESAPVVYSYNSYLTTAKVPAASYTANSNALMVVIRPGPASRSWSLSTAGTTGNTGLSIRSAFIPRPAPPASSYSVAINVSLPCASPLVYVAGQTYDFVFHPFPPASAVRLRILSRDYRGEDTVTITEIETGITETAPLTISGELAYYYTTRAGNSLRVRLVAGPTPNYQFGGFNVEAASVAPTSNCPTSMAPGPFKFPQLGLVYLGNRTCLLVLTVSAGNHVNASFQQLNLRPFTNDAVNVYDGPDDSSPLLLSYRGTWGRLNPSLDSVVSSGNSISVRIFIDAGLLNTAIVVGFPVIAGNLSAVTSAPPPAPPPDIQYCSAYQSIVGPARGSITAIAVPKNFTAPTGYPRRLSCSFLISSPDPGVSYSLLYIGLTSIAEPVLVYDGLDATAPLLARYMDHDLGPVATTNAEMFVTFNSSTRSYQACSYLLYRPCF